MPQAMDMPAGAILMALGAGPLTERDRTVRPSLATLPVDAMLFGAEEHGFASAEATVANAAVHADVLPYVPITVARLRFG